MKIVRLCLLLLLAVLLPWRGAVAAAMLCPPAVVPAQHVSHMAPLPTGTAATAATAATAQHAHQHHDPHAQGHHGHHALGQDAEGTEGTQPPSDTSAASQDNKCQLCAATCSVTALPDQAMALPAPAAATASGFPPLVAPVPDFLSDGQERPPRSI